MTWLFANWRVVVAGLAVIAAGVMVIRFERDAYQRGYTAAIAEMQAAEQERTNAANAADDVVRRCLLDPACRVLDDGWRRD